MAQSWLERLDKYTVYEYMLASVVILALASNLNWNASLWTQLKPRLPSILLVPLVAAALDVLLLKFHHKKSAKFPKNALITGLLIAGVFDPAQPILIPLTAATLAILSRHFIRKQTRNWFNPAAFGIVATSLLFTYLLNTPTGGIWWMGATPLILPLAALVIYKVRKAPLVASYLVAYWLVALFAWHLTIPQLLDPSLAYSYLFFPAFMLVEPKTAPKTTQGMLLDGALVVGLAYLLSLAFPALETTLMALLVANTVKEYLEKKDPE